MGSLQLECRRILSLQLECRRILIDTRHVTAVVPCCVRLSGRFKGSSLPPSLNVALVYLYPSQSSGQSVLPLRAAENRVQMEARTWMGPCWGSGGCVGARSNPGAGSSWIPHPNVHAGRQAAVVGGGGVMNGSAPSAAQLEPFCSPSYSESTSDRLLLIGWKGWYIGVLL